MNVPYNIFCYGKSIDRVQETPELYDLGHHQRSFFKFEILVMAAPNLE
jgi:hypothetical protein